ncbi:ATP-grasp domain-containing protein [Spirulina sp. 06S082]|uniref:ATP-grasp domain-containing protein n=1 Tax=Spirulina sp. 06S082 TaxID=3110248 RepID=UPI002B1E9670|nr:YheC/YheD family protein [Spirulina sp. 06S082]MEA5470900.1 YheC/YheD family protein [Spirulina sp. 06S082]
MLTNIRILIEACKQLKIDYDILHPTENLVRVKLQQNYYFVNYTVPLISQAIAKILIDKEYTYRLLKDCVNNPKTLAFLTPFCDEKYQQYLHFDTVGKIIGEIQTHFSFPVIIKRNRGTSGNNVFLCQNEREANNSLKTIFDTHSKNSDYVALAQEYINIEQEYRAVFLDRELILLYNKDNKNAKFTGNLSPLHWEGAKARHITDRQIVTEIQNFVNPVFQNLDISYGGFDIARDRHNQLWLIEINSHPNYNIFVRDNSEEIIIQLFRKILAKLQAN